MISIVGALVPVFLVILVGYGLTRFNFARPDDWRHVERIVYYVLFPALIASSIAKADLSGLPVIPFASTLVLTVLLAAGLLSILRRTVGANLGLNGPSYSSVYQGSLRWNGFVALAAVAVVYGEKGIAVAALAIAIMVPMLNVLSVVTLTRHAGKETPSATNILRNVSRNPLIIACLTGIFLNVTGIGIPEPLGTTASLLGRAALTLGLLAVGAGLDLNGARANAKLVGLACLIKLILIPISIAFVSSAFGISGFVRDVLILCGTVPTASSAYVLARQLGGDHQLMAAIITGSTMAAIATMPLMLYVLR
jgi:malonate transporter and related proteins